MLPGENLSSGFSPFSWPGLGVELLEAHGEIESRNPVDMLPRMNQGIRKRANVEVESCIHQRCAR